MIVLLIGGSGTLGKHMLPYLFENPQVERIRILSRGEHTQMEMYDSLPSEWKKRIDFLIGDVRDYSRVEAASKDCEIVYNLAAMKSVDKAEYDAWEAVLTNIIGVKNVIEATKKNMVSKAVFISTDKAVAALNLYGATKLVAEKLFIQANIGKHQTKYSVCRYANVLSSNGSVLKKWEKQLERNEKITLTHEEMTRLFILPSEAARFVVDRSHEMRGGEIFIPDMKSTSMMNLARAFYKFHTQKPLNIEDMDFIGIRPGEKLHEVLISLDEVPLTTRVGDYFIRWPNMNLFPILKRGNPMDGELTSYTARRFSCEELGEMIKWGYELSQRWNRPPEEPEKKSLKNVRDVELHSRLGNVPTEDSVANPAL